MNDPFVRFFSTVNKINSVRSQSYRSFSIYLTKYFGEFVCSVKKVFQVRSNDFKSFGLAFMFILKNARLSFL